MGRNVFLRPCGGNIPGQWSLFGKAGGGVRSSLRLVWWAGATAFHGTLRVLAAGPLESNAALRSGFIMTVIAAMIGHIIADGKWNGPTPDCVRKKRFSRLWGIKGQDLKFSHPSHFLKHHKTVFFWWEDIQNQPMLSSLAANPAFLCNTENPAQARLYKTSSIKWFAGLSWSPTTHPKRSKQTSVTSSPQLPGLRCYAFSKSIWNEHINHQTITGTCTASLHLPLRACSPHMCFIWWQEDRGTARWMRLRSLSSLNTKLLWSSRWPHFPNNFQSLIKTLRKTLQNGKITHNGRLDYRCEEADKMLRRTSR